MKVVALLAVVCLLGAVIYALAPDADAPFTHDAPAPAPAVLAEADEPELWVAPLPVEATEEEEEEEGELTGEEIVPEDIVLTGRVNPSNGPQPEVRVTFATECPPEDEACEASRLDTDADPETGDFAIVLHPGTWRIVARAEGFLPATEDGLTVAAGEELADLAMTLERGERITGTVRSEGEPAEGVRVVAIGEKWTRHAFADGFGHFAIEGLPRGQYTVRAYSEPYGGNEKLALTGQSVDLVLGHRAKLRGRVLDARGFPAEGAVVFSDYTPIAVSDVDPFPESTIEILGLGAHGCGPSPECYQRAVTDETGRFEVELAPGETLTIGARLGERVALVEEVGLENELVELTLREPGAKLQLVDAEGRPVPQAEVQIDPLPSFFREPPRSDGQGWVTLPDLTIERVLPPPGTRLVGELPKGARVEKLEAELIID